MNLKLKKKTTANEETQVVKKGKTKKKGVAKRVFAVLVLIFLVVCLGVGLFGLKMMKDMIDDSPAFNVTDFTNTESSKIYDANGLVIADIGLVNRENVSYEDMPQSFIDAIVAVEDSRYFEHNGFDLPRFVKSMLTNLRTLSFSQGASTLTMQLIRNVYFTDDTTATSRVKSISYKVQQIYLAIKGETEINKKRIFELYVNRINFGASTSRGIKGAAEYYFGKEPQELTLSESAYLAGVVNAPNGFNAYKHYEAAENRRNTVLYLMREHGYISNEEYQLAVSISLADQLVGVQPQNNAYQAYINEAVDECIELTGQDPYTTTMSIYTYMDRNLQEEIERIEAGESSVDWPDELMQCAIVSMDNSTGAILGVGGGRGSIVAKGYSRVSDMKKQPGSSVKPFLSYALAFEYLGWSTSHTVEDIPTPYRGTKIIIHNFDRSYSGDVLLTEAVGKSLNLPAYRTLEEVSDNIGSKAIVEYLNSLGFNQVTPENFDLGYAIGGSSFEVTVSQLAAAHSAMINGGNSVTPHTISRIEFADGSEPYIPSYPTTRVLSEEAAYQVASLMEQDVTGPYSNFMQLLKRKNFEVYAKTGTTSYDDSFVKFGIPSGAAKDKWMVASTGEVTTAVWVGYDIAVDGEDTYFSSKKSALNIPGKINNAILNVLYKDHNPANVAQPSGLVPISHIKGVFPYKAPVEGLGENMTVTGLIKKENYNLGTIEPPSFNATIGAFTVSNVSFSNGFVDATLNWSTYTGPSSDYNGDTTQYYYDEEAGKFYYDYEYVENDGKTVVVKLQKFFTGNALPTGMQYCATANGSLVAAGSDTTATVHLPIPADGSNITVTGYYAFSNGQQSNSISAVIPVSDHVKVINATVTGTGGTITGNGTYNIGSTATLVAHPDAGYRFKKWSSGELTPTLTFTVAADTVSPTAEFELIPSFTATFYAEDGTTPVGTTTVYENDMEGDISKPAAPDIVGKVFDHWEYSSSSAFPVTGDISAKAVYTVAQYTISFKENVNGTVFHTVTVNHGDTVTYPSYPTIDGYAWVNWDIGSISSATGDAVVTAEYTPIVP